MLSPAEDIPVAHIFIIVKSSLQVVLGLRELPPFIREACNLFETTHHPLRPLGQKPGPRSAPSNGYWRHYPLNSRKLSDLSNLIFCSLLLSEDHCRLKAWRGMTSPHRCPRQSGRGVQTTEDMSREERVHMHAHSYSFICTSIFIILSKASIR